MKDPTQEILDGLLNILNGNLKDQRDQVFFVTYDLPRVKKFNHVWLRTVRVNEDGTQDKYLSDCEVEIEIVCSGFKQQGNRSRVNYVSNQLTQLLIDNSISMTNFVSFINPHSVNMFEIEERTDDDIILRKNITIPFSVQQTGYKS
jgi:hypothetical protein